MTIADLSTLRSPNSVTIFAQPPGQAFVAFLLERLPIPTPGRVRLDLAESERASRRWTITRNPVERLVAQNRIREPDTLQVTGMLSANPLLSPLAPVGLARLDRFELLKLKVLIERLPIVPLFIVTPDRKHPNMMCTMLDELYDESTGNGVGLSMSFEEILIATPGLVAAALDLDALQLGAASSSSLGPTAPAAVPDPGGLG